MKIKEEILSALSSVNSGLQSFVELLYGASVLCSERSFIPTSRTRFDPYRGEGACMLSIHFRTWTVRFKTHQQLSKCDWDRPRRSCLKRDGSRSGARILSSRSEWRGQSRKNKKHARQRMRWTNPDGVDRSTYREDDAPVGDGSPEVGRLGAHWAVQERLERRRHGWRRARRRGRRLGKVRFRGVVGVEWKSDRGDRDGMMADVHI